MSIRCEGETKYLVYKNIHSSIKLAQESSGTLATQAGVSLSNATEQFLLKLNPLSHSSTHILDAIFSEERQSNLCHPTAVDLMFQRLITKHKSNELYPCLTLHSALNCYNLMYVFNIWLNCRTTTYFIHPCSSLF